jgi:hypothetical protein
MSKDMKLIMENWRKLVKENNEILTFEALVEKIQTLDEAGFKNLAIGTVAAGALGLGLSPNAQAGIDDRAGLEKASNPVIQQAGDIAGSKASGMGKDGKAFQNADKLSDYIVAQPKNVKDSQIIDLAMDNFGWDKSTTYDAYTILNSAIDAVKNYKAPTKLSQAKPEKEDDASSKTQTMQQKVRKANQDAFKSGKGGLGPLQ